MKIEELPIDDLRAYARNARTHSEEQVQQIARSITEYGFTNPVLIDENNEIIAGHGRTAAACILGLDEVPAIRLTGLSEVQKRSLRIADNQLALNAGWDDDLLRIELEEIQALDFDLSLVGFSLEELDDILTRPAPADPEDADEYENYSESGSLVKRYGVPPFSILDTRSGDWQARKRMWRDYGLESEKGRGEDLTFKSDALKKHFSVPMSGTSIFDPVLCELVYSWFTPEDGVIVDPFAGGSVRGVVASKLGRQYIGVDLRHEQVEENEIQWASIEEKRPFGGGDEVPPTWHCWDSLKIDEILPDVSADFVFSCPPYADLEKYSDDPADLSNMEYQDFLAAYREIIRKSCDMLKPDSFACFVVGEVRDKNGFYRGFVNDTIAAFEDAGLKFYNEIILINTAGSLPLRVQKIFNVSRKIGKCHQNVLVFVKGDPKNATVACGPVGVVDIEQ